MVRVICSVLLASVTAERIQLHAAKDQTQFGSTCEDLESSFHTRVAGLQTLLDAHPDDTTFNRITQARFTMRTLGVARTLRRARTCDWVVDGESEDINQMRNMVQVMLSGNPCANAARAELEAGASDEPTIELTAVRRAMSALVSENCEVTLPLDEDDGAPMDLEDEAVLESHIEQAEQQAQDGVDELMDSAANEQNSGAFVETNSEAKGLYGGFMRSLGVIFLFVLLLLACTSAMAIIGVFVASIMIQIGVITTCRGGYCGLNALLMGFQIGGVVGLGTCAYTLFTQLLPALEQ